MIYHQEDLSSLIEIGTNLILQLNEILISDEFVKETKEFLANNMVVLDSMNKVALDLQFRVIDNSPSQEFIKLYEETLWENYEFVKKMITN